MTQPLDDRDVAPWVEEEGTEDYKQERDTAEYEAYRESVNEVY